MGSLKVNLVSNVMENNSFVAAPVTFSAEKENVNLNMTGLDLFKVENGKIAEVWLFSDNEELEDQFWNL